MAAKKKRTTKKTIKKFKKKISKPKYVCYHCGTEVFMDCCGIGFRELVCCGEPMKKKGK